MCQFFSVPELKKAIMKVPQVEKTPFSFLAAITFGGIVEWYEIFLFIHWKDLFAKLFFDGDPSIAVKKMLLIFFIGFLGRPVGAMTFGDIGDRFGRKITFIASIILMAGPSIGIGCIGWLLPGEGGSIIITLCILRFIQGMAAGAELPAAICYLAECSSKAQRPYICSFAFLGPQIGIILSLAECYFVEEFYSQQFIETYGWRISFIAGGLLALFGLLLRNRLEETDAFQELKTRKLTSRRPILDSLSKDWKEITMGFFGSILAVVGFYMITVFIEYYLSESLEVSSKSNSLLLPLCLMIFSTSTLTLFGKLGNRYKLYKLLKWSAIGVSASLMLFSIANTTYIIPATILILFFLNMQFAILPSFVAELFPTSLRYTGLALSFSFCDSVVGGASPWLANMLTAKIGSFPTFIVFVALASLISLPVFIRKELTSKNGIK